ncbi:MAG: ABC transporter substrate-binding protein, partial [Halobacteriaceae archaeon]
MTDNDGGKEFDRRRMLKFTTGAVGLGLSGCASNQENQKTSPSDEPKQGGTLTVGMEAQLTGLDPHFTSSVVSWNAIYNICETLITFEDGAEPVGRIADNWTISSDGLRYTFQLKEGIQFHPPVNRELLAEDVVYSFERMAQPKAMGSDLSAMKSVEATGSHEVTFTLKEKFAPFLNFLGRVPWVIVPREAVENQGGSLGSFQRPVGTGPFKFDKHQQGQFLRLKAFENYREEEVPYLDAIRLEPIVEGSSRVSALQAGDVDMARAIPGQDADTIKRGANTTLIKERATSWGQLHINCSRDPWNDPTVRRAVAHVMPRESIVQAGLFGHGEVAYQPYPSGNQWHYDLAGNQRERDVQKAKSLLEEAGNPLEGKTLTIKTNTSYQLMQTTAELLVSKLNEAGIDARTQTLEWGTQLSDFINGNFDAMAFEVPYKVDPDRHYYGFIHPSTSQWNKYGAEQPDADRMYELLEQG